MSYLTIATMKDDGWLRARVAACAALEGITAPAQWAVQHAWELATQTGWAAAWEESTSDTPGTDPDAISDAMILTAVQELIAADAAPAP